MSAHTPGPWEYGTKSGNKRTDGSGWGAEGFWSGGNLVIGSADGWEGGIKQPSEADARLIAAAPEMLEALEKATYLCSCTRSCPECDFLNEIINKARGKS